MPNILLLATAWGPKHGGMNAFNMDFAQGLRAYLQDAGRVFCAVLDASSADVAHAAAQGITLLSIERSPESASYDSSWAYEVWKRLQQQYPDQAIDWWVGHDVISGAAALEGPDVAHYGRTAVIMHMSYSDYAAYKHGSGVNAVTKDQQQRTIFTRADKHFAVGPLLRDAMRDMVDGDVTMLVPGFAAISRKLATAHVDLITFGRMDRESDRIKQGSLAVAGFASACRRAHDIPGFPASLRDHPRMRVIGIAQEGGAEERQLRQLASTRAGRVVTILAQPFTADREALFAQLGRATLALMLSWHEGFGLTGWEAIAAQVPLIVSRQSGLYRLVHEYVGDPGTACLKVLDIQGQYGGDDTDNFTTEDEEHVRDAILDMVSDMARWQKNADFLKNALTQKLGCTWEQTAKDFCAALGLEVSTPPATGVEEPGADAPASAPHPEVMAVETHSVVSDNIASPLIQIPHLEWPDVLRDDVPDRFLLLPSSGIVPFHQHRHGILQQNLDWVLAAEQPIQLRLLVGPGGTGKTRLLIEVCRRLQAQHGWQAGFLQPVANPAQELQALLRTAHGCLIVIDYAETRAAEVVDLVRAARSVNRQEPLCLVLLARGGGDWWEHLLERAKDDPAVATILHSPRTRQGPYRMSEVDIDPEERPAIFREALVAFAVKTGREVPHIPTPNLSAAFFQHLLFLHLAALAALRGRAITDHKALLLATLRHEREYWRRAFADAEIDVQYLDGFEQLLALLTLIGGTRSAAETRQVIKLTPRLRGAAPLLQDRIFDILRPFYGRDGGVLGIEPDLLGERLVAEALARDDELLDVVFKQPRNTAERVRYAYTVLTRLARQDQHERQWLQKTLERYLQHTADDAMAVAMETGSPMPEMIAAVLQNPKTAARQKLINTLRVQVPKETINLLELAVTIAEQHVTLLAEKGNKKSFTIRLKAKDAYALLASRYEATGRFTEALGALQEARAFAQASVSSKPNAVNRHALAQVSTALANMYAKTCHFREALESAQHAESILRTLAQEQPRDYPSGWAISLGNLSNCLSNLRHYAEALEYAQQAEHSQRELAQVQPEVYRSAWVASLHNLSRCLRDLGHYAEALEYAQQAEHSQRELAQTQPEVYQPDWVISLNNQGHLLNALGRYGEALEYAQQAERLWRALVQAQPEVYRPNWAIALCNVAETLFLTGETHCALPAAEQATELYATLALSHPETYQEHYGWCHRILAEILLASGAPEQALGKAHEAVTLLGEMFSERPGYAPSQYGKALEVLARCQQAHEDMTASLQTLRLTVRELRPHYERHPAALQTVMHQVVESLRRLTPASLAQDVPQTILDLLERQPTPFAITLFIDR